jgi:hypothetical protein
VTFLYQEPILQVLCPLLWPAHFLFCMSSSERRGSLEHHVLSCGFVPPTELARRTKAH